MSPPPPASNPEDYQQAVKDGVIASALGSAAMVARLLLSTEPVSLGWVIRRILAAAITAAFVGWAVAEHIQSIPLRFAAVGASGYAAPEVLDYLLAYLKARGDKEIAAVKKGVPNAKKRATKKRR
jgi:hypothetical protein